MDSSIRVMVERGKKKQTVASAFDWSGWDRSGNTEEDALRVLESYRPRYAKVAALAGLSDEFGVAVELTVVERLEGLALLPVPLGILWASTPANASRPARLAGRNALLRTTAYH